ncbi:hypothetical protein EGN72_02300 [Pseudorhodobacter sp. E13]|uniref:hypothetical protein n=1 Tax=Pseudorhodobacter sp. E13 TaxID=2487931 RepID=UPI000F8C67B9|nr:hypothetical protein [Pseudorhodobacter sp. E13]RUS64935.1 hypothetical protein EGN72_02300 [Pseudorhodobacter sp. E13]
MTKHLADHRNPPNLLRRKYFWALERTANETAPHPVIKTLSKRAQPRTDASRMQHFLRIERGEMA